MKTFKRKDTHTIANDNLLNTRSICWWLVNRAITHRSTLSPCQPREARPL